MIKFDVRTIPSANVTEVSSDEIEVKSSYQAVSNILTIDLYNKNTRAFINSYLLQLDPMLGSQTKVIKEIDNGSIKIIQTKNGNGFDLDIEIKDITTN